MAPKRVSDRVFDSELVFQPIFIDFLAFLQVAPAVGGTWFALSWESSPSADFREKVAGSRLPALEKWGGRPQYRASFQLALREYKLACISYTLC